MATDDDRLAALRRERRSLRCELFLSGVPDERLDKSDPAAAMFLAYLRGDETAAIAFADEVQAACNRGKVRLRDDVYRGYDEPIPWGDWGQYGPDGIVGNVICKLIYDKYTGRDDSWPRTFSLAEVCAKTEADLLRLYNVGHVTVRRFRAWLAARGLRLRDG